MHAVGVVVGATVTLSWGSALWAEPDWRFAALAAATLVGCAAARWVKQRVRP
ncbi:hypothetical protein [Lentzea guizhouensis]|uniref:hypothetical protein n=1 Tax=Lentzea guizhouensis TaxID=1586287 RepID=UPI0012B6A295|nr:hypothetical protein [Lentzea guizhouensis]